jgi:ribA/ribD-fused uncharacterized protein
VRNIRKDQFQIYVEIGFLINVMARTNITNPALIMKDKIKFYSVTDKYGDFSNFAKYPIKIKGKVWKTSEHYFQAMKFDSAKDQQEIQQAKTAIEAARKGRYRKRKLRNNWESMKDNVMREAVYAKFSQHSELKQLLLSTGDAIIVEHTENDDYWGDGGDGHGKNMLGRILMETREICKSTQ